MLIELEPLDTLFFRDGRPYNHGEGTSINVLSQFPPSPASMVGAVRAAWARALGWSGSGRWSSEIHAALGGDGDSLGALSFRGPFLTHDGRALFPLPASVIGVARDCDSPGDMVQLSPGGPGSEPGFRCDLGDAVALPMTRAKPVPGRKTLEGWWIDAKGLAGLLAGKPVVPDSLVHARSLWQREARVAIARDPSTRTTGIGDLFSPIQIRLHRGVRLGLVAVGLPQTGDPAATIASRPQPLGGESRACWMTARESEAHEPWPAPPSLSAGDPLRYSAYIATPLPLAEPPRPGSRIPGLPGILRSACLPRYQWWGGWDSIKHRPLALQPHLAPGSMLFMQAPNDSPPDLLALHGTTIGERASWGYGLIFIGGGGT